MVNRHRGEVALVLGEMRHTLVLTLQALAEIEAAFGAADLASVGDRFAAGRLGARDLIPILGAAARAGGGTLSDGALAASITAADLPRVVAALGALFASAFGDAQETAFGEAQESAFGEAEAAAAPNP